MAIKVGNIPAFDQYPTVGIGLSVPFKTGFLEASGSTATSGSDAIFNINYTTAEQVKYNLINYFLTSKGERVFNPSFGSNVQAFLFEQNDPSALEILKKSIEEDISLVFSVIELKEIKIIADEDYYSVTIQIFYSVFSSLNEFVEFNMPL